MLICKDSRSSANVDVNIYNFIDSRSSTNFDVNNYAYTLGALHMLLLIYIDSRSSTHVDVNMHTSYKCCC